MPAIFLSFDAAARANYYGDTALAALRRLGEVRLHDGAGPLDAGRARRRRKRLRR